MNAKETNDKIWSLYNNLPELIRGENGEEMYHLIDHRLSLHLSNKQKILLECIIGKIITGQLKESDSINSIDVILNLKG